MHFSDPLLIIMHRSDILIMLFCWVILITKDLYPQLWCWFCHNMSSQAWITTFEDQWHLKMNFPSRVTIWSVSQLAISECLIIPLIISMFQCTTWPTCVCLPVCKMLPLLLLIQCFRFSSVKNSLPPAAKNLAHYASFQITLLRKVYFCGVNGRLPPTIIATSTTFILGKGQQCLWISHHFYHPHCKT